MSSYDHRDVYSKIASLEDKVNRLEEIIDYGNRGDYSCTLPYCDGGTRAHYKSAVRLSRDTRNFKQDLLQNPRHNELSKENYQQVYKRVSALDKELNQIVRSMYFERRPSRRSDYSYTNRRSQIYYDDSSCKLGCDAQPKRRIIIQEPQRKHFTYTNSKSQSYYDDSTCKLGCDAQPKRRIIIQEPQRKHFTYTNSKSQSYYDDSTCKLGCDAQPRRRTIIREPQRKRISYDEHVELIPNDTSSSESIEEIIYYIESSSTSPSSSSVIVEEYVPKHYTRRSVREAPFIDVSKSRPRPSVEKTPIHKTRHKRKSAPEISVTKPPKARKSKNERKKIQVVKSDSTSDTAKNKSEMFLVKKSIEPPTKTKKQKDKEKKEKYFVSRLKRVESPANEGNDEAHERASSQQKPPVVKNISKSGKKKSSNRKGSRQEEESNKSETKLAKFKKRDKKKAKQEVQSPEKSTETITVARSSFILNDPFVRTIYYDDSDPSREENKTSYSSNIENSYHCRTKQNLQNNKSESPVRIVCQNNWHDPSVYEMSNSIYYFDPFLKRKEKLYPKDSVNSQKLSNNSNKETFGKNKSKVHNVNKNDIIVLNDEKLKPHQKKFTFKQRENPINLDDTVSNVQKGKIGIKNEKRLSWFEEDTSSLRALSPIAHSVYLTTVPIYKTSSPNLQLPSASPKKLAVQSEIEEENCGLSLDIPPHQKSVVEDDILMTVARKLSPVVAKIINTQYHRGKDNHRTQSETTLAISKTEFPCDNNSYKFNSQITQSDILSNSKDQYSSLLIEDKQSKYHRKIQKHILSSTSSENEIIIEINNPSKRKRKFVNNQVYYSKLEDDSPLQQNQPLNNRKSTLKKMSVASVTSFFKKGKERKDSKSASGKLSEDMIKKRESFAQEQPGSKLSLKPQRSSHIIPNVHRSSQINQKQGGSRSRSPSDREEDEKILQSSRNSPSRSRAQSIQPKKSIIKSASPSSGIKSVLRVKSILRRMTSKEKGPKMTKEPTVMTEVSKMENSKESTTDLQEEGKQEAHKLSVVYPAEDLGEEQTFVSKTDYLTAKQSREMRKQSDVASRQNSEQELPPDMEFDGRSSKHLIRKQSQEAKKQSKVSSQGLDLIQEPYRKSSRKTSKLLTRGQSQVEHTKSKTSPRQSLEQESVQFTGMNSTREFKNSMQNQSQDVRPQSKVSPRQDLDQEPVPYRLNSIKLSKHSTQDRPTYRQSKVGANKYSVKDNQELEQLGSGYIAPEMNRLSEKSGSEIFYSGSREFLKEIRSVSGYYNDQNLLEEETNVEREEPRLSQEKYDEPRLSQEKYDEPRLSQEKYDEPVETIVVDTLQSGSLVEEENPEITAANQTVSEDRPYHNSFDSPKTFQEPRCKPMKPLQFCIHFSKEKRSKFESQSTLSLDNILSSQCKKIYSSEDLSLSEYAFDKNSDSYRHRKIRPKVPKNSFKPNVKCPAFLKAREPNNKYHDYFMKGIQSKSPCCCKTSKITKSEQLISDSSTYVDWHKVANEVKQIK